MYTCLRCKRSFFQKKDFRAVLIRANAMIDAGQLNDAIVYVKDKVSRGDTTP